MINMNIMSTALTRGSLSPRVVMALVWCLCMVLDYLSGSAAAMVNRDWCSTRAREGLWHKGGMILVVAVAAIADAILGIFGFSGAGEGLFNSGGIDGLLRIFSAYSEAASQSPAAPVSPVSLNWPGLLLPLVLGWYIITELGSVLENALAMGAPVPGWLRKILKSSLDTVNQAGESTANNFAEKHENHENQKEEYHE